LRAHVRADLLPLLEAINPRFDEALARTFRVLEDDEELLESMASAFGGGFTQREGDDLFFDRTRMQTLSASIMRRAVRVALQEAFPETSRIEFEHVEAIAAGMADDGFARDLPGGIRAFSEYDTLVVSRAADATPALAPSLLEVPGRVDLGPAGVLTAEIVVPVVLDSDEHVAFLDASRVTGALTVDSVRPGDRMRPFGMEGTRKLQDLLTDAKVPRRRRPVTPVVRDGEAIVWLAGVRASEEYRIGPETTSAIRLVWTGPPEAEVAEA